MNVEKKKDINNEAKGNKPAEPDSKDIKAREIGGPAGLEPTRYGDWEKKGRCIDF